MSTETKTFVLPDSRIIAWCEFGSATSPHPPIFYFHGSPSSRFEGALYHNNAVDLNLRIIAPDRPSSGLSSPLPGRTFLDYPSDVLALAVHLDIAKFHVIGSSGGAPYALVCLKTIARNQCLSTQVVSGIAPVLKLGTDGSMSNFFFPLHFEIKADSVPSTVRFIQKAVMFVSYYSPGTSGALMDWTFGAACRNPDPTKLEDMLAAQMETLPKSDQEACKRPGVLETLTKATREAFRQGGDLAATEFGLWSRDWGFDFEDIDARGLTIWHGKEDGNCGFAAAAKGASLLLGAETMFFHGEGHYVFAYHGEEILRRCLS
jgi:pimeloyl-ACP methyl ester carboxylesterase